MSKLFFVHRTCRENWIHEPVSSAHSTQSSNTSQCSPAQTHNFCDTSIFQIVPSLS